MCRLSADSGRNSLKLTMNISFNDDPLLYADAPPGARERHAARNEGLYDTGVERTYILVLIPGAPETPETVKWLWKVCRFSLLCRVYPNAIVCSPNDIKMQNELCGIGDAGSRFPHIYNLYSQFRQFSRPDIERTVESIIGDNKAREEAISRGGKLLSDL